MRKHTYGFRGSLDNVLLCHYLIRRIAISKRRKRGNFIQFSTIREITGIRDEACLFHKKAAAIMDHYRQMGYFYDYQLYITDYAYELTDGGKRKDSAYFQVQAQAVIKYWKLHNRKHLLLSDFLVSWSGKLEREIPEEGEECGVCENVTEEEGGPRGDVRREVLNLCADTKRRLALVSLEQMDGMVLRHE